MAKRPHHCILTETIESHYVIEAANRQDAAFKLALAISADPPTIKPERRVTVKTATHISAIVEE